MKVFITGATGFLGGHVVRACQERGHAIRAMVRRSTGLLPAGVEPFQLDLRAPRGLADALRGVDTVIHLAAAKSGDLYTQYAGTVVATENLLRAMEDSGVRRIILVSSFAVYDYRRMWRWSRMDERSPLQNPMPPRDAYSHTKRVQEDLVRRAAERLKWDYAVLRPGAIYGPDNIWTARLGFSASPTRWRRIGWFSRLPLTYVENCAEAIAMAAERPGPMALTLNIVDSDAPTQSRYCAEVFRRLRPCPRRSVVPLTLVRAAAFAAAITNKVIFRGRARLPAVLVPAQLDARFKSLRFSNAAALGELGWRPRFTLQQALDRTLSPGDAPRETVR